MRFASEEAGGDAVRFGEDISADSTSDADSERDNGEQGRVVY